jgi:hypothetical protein
MRLLLLVILFFAGIPAAICLFTVLATQPSEWKSAIKAAFSHFGALLSLLGIVGFVLVLVFQ